jgi:glycosyltransferase involved in cell wall biosynthesis
VEKQSYRVVVLSFEGPDAYSFVGGLGVRVAELTQALSEAEIQTQLVFIGEPDAPAVERVSRFLELRRWGQWISEHHRGGVYDGEAGKVLDYSRSVPPFLVDEIIAPAAARGERVLILAEDWQTADAVILLDRMLRGRGLRHAATMIWNANNTYGFEKVDMKALAAACTLTAVSKYMKFELAAVGVPSLVIPNGIPPRLLKGPSESHIKAIRDAVGSRPFFAKVGRYSPDKAWFQAIDGIAGLREQGIPARLIVRGGKEPYGEEVMARARKRGLRVVEVRAAGRDVTQVCDAIKASDGHIIDLRAFLEEPLLYALYAAADGVLANSKKEPFGLVGLEVMAAGGIAICGSTGEEYAEPFVNAVVTDTDNGSELSTALEALVRDPELGKAMRAAGKSTAARYVWPTIIETLWRKLPFVEYLQHHS